MTPLLFTFFVCFGSYYVVFYVLGILLGIDTQEITVVYFLCLCQWLQLAEQHHTRKWGLSLVFLCLNAAAFEVMEFT